MSHTLDQAGEFVRRRGSATDRARLSHVLYGHPVEDATRSEMFAGQRDDGGWAPFWASGYSSLDATCFRLAQAEQLGIPAGDDGIRRAIGFLAGRQRAGGFWEEEPVFAGQAPPWAAPGKDDARAYLTANCGFWVAAMGATDAEKGPAALAAETLAAGISSEGDLPGLEHTSWLAAGLWRLTGRDDLASRTERWLEQRVRTGLTASSLTWLLSTLRIAGVAPTTPLVHAALSQLMTQQRLDGGWPSEDGPAREPHVTLEAMRALLWVERGM